MARRQQHEQPAAAPPATRLHEVEPARVVVECGLGGRRHVAEERQELRGEEVAQEEEPAADEAQAQDDLDGGSGWGCVEAASTGKRSLPGTRTWYLLLYFGSLVRAQLMTWQKYGWRQMWRNPRSVRILLIVLSHAGSVRSAAMNAYCTACRSSIVKKKKTPEASCRLVVLR